MASRTNVLIFPCLDEARRYSGCVGLRNCTVARCWNGRRIRAREYKRVQADRFDVPVHVERYTACLCPTCANAVDLDGDLLSPGGRKIERWTTCREGLWMGPVSIYNLVYRRIPLKWVGPCELYRPSAEMRPEVAKKRQEDRERTRRWKIAKKAERLEKAS
ncbi:MAG: hypothetical protein KGJ86_20880 [Chloroflexota bacterium]|nr:hypothetical protein [Chloroflexota bacterium]